MGHTSGSLPAYTTETALLVVLSKVPLSSSDQTALASLRSKLQSLGTRSLQIWLPSTPTLQDFAYVGNYLDSQAVIYGIAVAALREGWGRFMVADGLSFRQVGGLTRTGEDEEWEVIEVGTSVIDQNNDGVNVVVRRSKAIGIGKKLLKADFDNSSFQAEPLLSRVDRPRNTGLRLHDPDRTPFKPDMITTGREDLRSATTGSISNNISLPPEIQNIVLTLVDTQHITIGDVEVDPESFLIYALFPMSKVDLEESEQKIHEAFRQHGKSHLTKKFRLLPWKGKSQVTRRDLMTLFERVKRAEAHHDITPAQIFILDRPFSSETDIELGHLTWHYELPTHHERLTVTSLIEGVEKVASQAATRPGQGLDEGISLKLLSSWNSKSLSDSQYLENDDIELSYHPEKPFYDTPPPWAPGKRAISAPAVFWLTKHQTAAEMKKVKEGLETEDEDDVLDDDEKKEFCYVPWDRDEDGTVEDMWSLMVKCYLETDYDLHRHGSGQAFFIDRESARDGKVILADLEYDPEWFEENHISSEDKALSPYRGIQYGRVEASSAMITWVNLDIANMGFEDFFDDESDMHRYTRTDCISDGLATR